MHQEKKKQRKKVKQVVKKRLEVITTYCNAVQRRQAPKCDFVTSRHRAASYFVERLTQSLNFTKPFSGPPYLNLATDLTTHDSKRTSNTINDKLTIVKLTF